MMCPVISLVYSYHGFSLIFTGLHRFHPMTDCQISPGIKKASKLFLPHTQKSFLSLLPICVWIHPPTTHTQWKLGEKFSIHGI